MQYYRNAFYTITTTFYIHFYPISAQQDAISDVDATTVFYLQTSKGPKRVVD